MLKAENNISRRDFLKKLWIVAWSTVVLATWWKLLYNLIADDEIQTLFNKKYYLDISGGVTEEYMDHELLFEEMPTVYDNILYAKEINWKKNVKDTVIYKTCTRMQPLENTINAYAAKYHIPANKLLWLIFLESEGKANAGNKWLGYRYNCYGYAQLSVLVWKEYWAIKKDSKGRWRDRRDNLETALDTTCKFLTDIHKKRTDHGHNDNNRSLTFASYHMWETHMNKILEVAQNKANTKANNMQDLIGLNNKEVANEFMDLQDESYKYYPKLLAAWRIYSLFKSNRNQFNKNVQVFLESPIKRKPSLSEEYVRYGKNNYYKDNEDIKKGMESGELFGVKKINKNVQIDDEIWIKKINSQSEITHKEQKELMKMSSKAIRWLIKFISSHYRFDIKLTSLIRSEAYNEVLSGVKGKRTSHATWYAVDLWFPSNWEKKKYLKWILYWLEVQGKIAFIQENNHFHVIINPKHKDFFENIVDNR